MKKLILYFAAPLLLALFFSCSRPLTLTRSEVSQVRINTDSLSITDTAMLGMIRPYRQKLDSQMNVIIGFTQTELVRARPEGTLGNLVADAALEHARSHYGKPVDVCVMNYGGIRIPGIARGVISVSRIFELMPFENEVVVIEVSGKTLLELLNLAAASEGWPVSGIIMEIKDRKVTFAFAGTTAIEPGKTYALATNDYLANGGDQASMLKDAIAYTSLNYKLRDAIIDYIKMYSPLNMQTEGRVIKAAQ